MAYHVATTRSGHATTTRSGHAMGVWLVLTALLLSSLPQGVTFGVENAGAEVFLHYDFRDFLGIDSDFTFELTDGTRMPLEDRHTLSLSVNGVVVALLDDFHGRFNMLFPMFSFFDLNFTLTVYDTSSRSAVPGAPMNHMLTQSNPALGMLALHHSSYWFNITALIPNKGSLVGELQTLCKFAQTFMVTGDLAERGHVQWVPIIDDADNPSVRHMSFHHHQVFRNWNRWIGRIVVGHWVDFLGVVTPLEWDCDTQHGYDYSATVPSRVFACEAVAMSQRLERVIRARVNATAMEQQALQADSRDSEAEAAFGDSDGGDSDADDLPVALVAGNLPLIDEEYFEWVVVLQSVLYAAGSLPNAAMKTYTVIEMGARYATWGVRAAMAHRRLWEARGVPATETVQRVIATELLPELCDWCEQHGKANDVNVTVDCNGATSTQLLKFLRQEDRIDLLDTDIQGAEWDIFLDGTDEDVREIHRLMLQKVAVVYIGVHVKFGEALRRTFASMGWSPVLDLEESQMAATCDRLTYDAVMRIPACMSATTYGPVYVRDGAMAFVNPTLVDAHAFGNRDWALRRSEGFSFQSAVQVDAQTAMKPNECRI